MKRGLHGAVAMLLVMLLLITSMPMAALAEIVKVDTSSGIQPFSILPGGTAVLTYEFYVGGELVDTQRVGDGETLVAPKTPTQDGHKFMGWTEDPNVSNPTYQSFETSINVTETKTIKLYAHFEEVYYVFFMDDGGRVYETRWGTSGQKIEADVTFPVGSDEAITGWYDNPDCKGEKVESVVLDHSNVTLYPNVEQGAWLTFDSAGGTYIEPVFVAPGQTTSQPEVPTRAGYNFEGWYQGETKFEFGSGIEENTTLTARWTARNDTPYTVIYWIENADDDGYTYEKSVRKTGETDAVISLTNADRAVDNLNSEYRQYYDYASDDANINGISKTVAANGSTVINVYFKRKTYTFTFEKRNYYWGSYQTIYSFSAKYGEDISDKWSFRGSDGVNYPETNQVTSWTPTGSSTYTQRITRMERMPAENITFRLTHSDNRARTFNYYIESLDGTQGNKTYNGVNYDLYLELQHDFNQTYYNDDFFLLQGFERNQITTINWGQESVMNRGPGSSWQTYSVTNFYYLRKDYTLEFRNVDTTDKIETVQFEAPLAGLFTYQPSARPAGIPANYVFGGWYTSPACEDGTEASENLEKMPAGNVVVFAKWAPPKHTVNFYDIEDNLEISYEVEDSGSVAESGAPNIQVPEGSTFRGWCTREPNGDGTYLYTPFNFSTKIYRDYDLYPYITSNAAFHVTYDAGKGTGEVEDSTNYAQYSYADVKSGAELEPPEGQVFLYWQVEGSDTKYYPNDKIYITGDVKLIAIYGPTPEGTQITYIANYPEGTDPDPYVDSLANNAEHTVLSLTEAGFFEPEGYEFVGWSTEMNAPTDDIDSKVDYEAGETIIVNKNKAESENILYGCWKPKKGTLVIEKSLPEAGGGGNEFMFEVRKKGNNEVVKTVTVTVDGTTGSQTITLPEGTYIVTEKLQNSQDYYEQPEEQTVIVRRGDEERVIFTNTLKKYTVTIEKQVTGNMYNTNDEFKFEATVTFEGMPYRIQKSNDEKYQVAEDGTITFTLKGGQSVVLQGVPKYATVTVKETNAEDKDYKTSYQMGGNKTQGSTATIDVQGNMSVTFINDKTVTIDTGVNLDVLPYLLMLAVAGGAVALLLVLKRRKTQE